MSLVDRDADTPTAPSVQSPFSVYRDRFLPLPLQDRMTPTFTWWRALFIRIGAWFIRRGIS